MRALAPVMPEAVSAGVGNLKVVAFSGEQDGRAWVYMDIFEGSYGGRHGKDGLDAVDTLYANTRNNPVEDIESHYPLRVTRYELRSTEPAPGAGAAGSARCASSSSSPTAASRSRATATSCRRRGCSAAAPGRRGHAQPRRRAGEASLPSKIPFQRVRAGEVLRLVAPCGGGYGDPALRDAAPSSATAPTASSAPRAHGADTVARSERRLRGRARAISSTRFRSRAPSTLVEGLTNRSCAGTGV